MRVEMKANDVKLLEPRTSSENPILRFITGNGAYAYIELDKPTLNKLISQLANQR